MIDFKGLAIQTSENVYTPAEDSFLAVEILEEQLKGKNLAVLDIGSGSGILGLIAAKSRSVEQVIFTDINEDAIKLCKENIEYNKKVLNAECDVVETDLFSNIDGTFDIILFNAPYLKSDENDKSRGKIATSWSGGKEGIETSLKFLDQARKHMKNNGKIILIASSYSNLEKLKSEAEKIGFRREEERKIHIFFEDIVAIVFKL